LIRDLIVLLALAMCAGCAHRPDDPMVSFLGVSEIYELKFFRNAVFRITNPSARTYYVIAGSEWIESNTDVKIGGSWQERQRVDQSLANMRDIRMEVKPHSTFNARVSVPGKFEAIRTSIPLARNEDDHNYLWLRCENDQPYKTRYPERVDWVPPR
jgi:hypothetical protein